MMNRRAIVPFFIGVGSALVGLLPWLITGARLPLQNLWATDTLPADMPIALLPFSQYQLSVIVAIIVVGSAIGGLISRATGMKAGTVLSGVLLVQLGALVQTAFVVEQGLRPGVPSTVYLVALVAGTVVAILLGVLVLLLIARAPRAGAVIAFSIAGIALGSWLGGLFFPLNRLTFASDLTTVLGEITRFAPAVVVGAAIGWAGLRTTGRAIAAGVGILLLWIGPTLVTAVSAAAGTRILAPYPAEMLEYGMQVFMSALGMPELHLPVVAVALVVAAVGLLVGRLKRR